MSLVYCKLPKAGLGNQLFPLMKAFTFGALNNVKVVVTGYHKRNIGPYLRREKIKRNYRNYFKFQRTLPGEIADFIRIRLSQWNISEECPLVKMENIENKKLFVYSKMPHWSDFFSQLKDHRELVIKLFDEILHEDIKKQVSIKKIPCIGIHIRMGDFRKLKAGEDFRMVGAVRTPEDYFIEIIETIRRIHGTSLPVTVFTDGYRHEFERLFQLPDVDLEEGNADMVDLLLLSKSKVIVTSAGSTFSYWAGFLSNAALIMHPDHIHHPLRPAHVNEIWYEGPIIRDQSSPLLIRNIKTISLEPTQTC